MIERSSAYNKKNRVLAKLALLLYGKLKDWALQFCQCLFLNGVISHDEALYHYGLIDCEPAAHTITVYSGYNTSRLNKAGYKTYYMKNESATVKLDKIEEIFQKDIRSRLKIRNRVAFNAIMEYFIANFGASTNLTNTVRDLITEA